MAGIATGYKKGLTAIIDANVVTIMVAFILFVLATAGVKGFALTLGLGVIVSLFTAVLATQAILGTMGKSRLISSPSALGAGEKSKPNRFRLDYMGYSKWFFSASGRDPARLRAGARLEGHQLRHRLRVGHADQRRADREGRSRPTCTRCWPQNGQADAEVQSVENKSKGASKFQISTSTLGPDRGHEDHRRAEVRVRLRRHGGLELDRADVRQDGGERRRSSRSSRRCW